MVKVNGKWLFAQVAERNRRIVRDRVWVEAPTSIIRKANPLRRIALRADLELSGQYHAYPAPADLT